MGRKIGVRETFFIHTFLRICFKYGFVDNVKKTVYFVSENPITTIIYQKEKNNKYLLCKLATNLNGFEF